MHHSSLPVAPDLEPFLSVFMFPFNQKFLNLVKTLRTEHIPLCSVQVFSRALSATSELWQSSDVCSQTTVTVWLTSSPASIFSICHCFLEPYSFSLHPASDLLVFLHVPFTKYVTEPKTLVITPSNHFLPTMHAFFLHFFLEVLLDSQRMKWVPLIIWLVWKTSCLERLR